MDHVTVVKRLLELEKERRELLLAFNAYAIAQAKRDGLVTRLEPHLPRSSSMRIKSFLTYK